MITAMVSGSDERATGILMGLIREFGWSAPEISYPTWSDEPLKSALSQRDDVAVQAIVDRRYAEHPKWVLRLPPVADRLDLLPLLRNVGHVVVVGDDQSLTDAHSWMTGLPDELVASIRGGAPTMLVSAGTVHECSAALLAELAMYLGVTESLRRSFASAWARLYRQFPDLPLGLFKTNGMIDQATKRGGGGWAYIEGVLAPVDMEIQVNGRSMLVTSNLPRPDLMARGFHGTGNCGFSFKFPPDVTVNADDLVYVRVIGEAKGLINSPAQARAPSKAGKNPPPAALLGETDKVPVETEEEIELLKLPRLKARPSHLVFVSSLWAFLLREIQARFGTKRAAYAWAIIEPALQIIVLTLLVRGIKGRLDGKIYGEDAVFFFSLGVVPYQMFSHAMSSSGIQAGSGLFNFRQIRPIDIGLVRAFIEFVTYGIILVAMLAVSNFLGYDYTIDEPLLFLYCIFLLFWMGFAIGLFFDVLINIVQQARFVQSLLIRILFVTSGVFYSIDGLPASIQPYLLWNPMLHIIDQVRASAIKGYPGMGDLGYATVCTIVFLFIALAFYRRNLHRLF